MGKVIRRNVKDAAFTIAGNKVTRGAAKDGGHVLTCKGVKAKTHDDQTQAEREAAEHVALYSQGSAGRAGLGEKVKEKYAAKGIQVDAATEPKMVSHTLSYYDENGEEWISGTFDIPEGHEISGVVSRDPNASGAQDEKAIEDGLTALRDGLKRLIPTVQRRAGIKSAVEARSSMDSYIDGNQKPVPREGLDAYLNA